MKFGLFVYCTVGRRHELEQGMAGMLARQIDTVLRLKAVILPCTHIQGMLQDTPQAYTALCHSQL